MGVCVCMFAHSGVLTELECVFVECYWSCSTHDEIFLNAVNFVCLSFVPVFRTESAIYQNYPIILRTKSAVY